MLTDSFLESQGGLVPTNHLCAALGELCIPLAGRRIMELREIGPDAEDLDELMIELELCLGLIFKPLRHHLQNVVKEGLIVLLSLWTPILDVSKEILKEPAQNGHSSPSKLVQSSNDLTIEHLRNVIMVLISFGVLKAEPQAPDDITALTWEAVAGIDSCKNFLDEWKQAASQAPVEA
jgi:hypothetical protein